ncbi:hypothetical protein KUW17_04930 [Leisingera aquaemixtae]|uniref:hypothetical protein n=1 Tax=Leisingera aquaemixtae TaxID=1396826 RepID=UPI001C95CF57|nr:hypothetical protein [Leisingera aquaemixtae]MBY6066074.1 hypothetical protein [Leisingera aquaemixtae]
MNEIVLLDTSVYLNILDVPGWNQDRDQILNDFEVRIKSGDIFLLPMATIWETGNHIADVKNGAHRRKYAEILVSQVMAALEGETPYRATHFPDKSEFGSWISDFPEYAQINKSEKKTREGVSLSDMSIIKEWEMLCERHSMSSVLIWSLDADLASYHRVPGK